MGAGSKTVNIDGVISSTSTDIGTTADAVASTDTGTFSLISLFKRLLQGITTLITNTSPQAAKTLVYLSTTKASSGNNTLVSANATQKFVIVGLVLQLEASTATTMILQDGAGGTAMVRVLAQNQGDGLTLMFPADARPKGTVNTLLNLNLSGANSCGVTVFYYLE